MDDDGIVEPVDGAGGRWFEELPVGLVVRHALTRTVTEADNLMFCALTHNPQPLHLDAEFAGATEFGQIVVNGIFTFGLMVGISVNDTTLGTLVANLGYDKVVMPKPVFVGDTLRAESEVVDLRPSRSRPGQGIVTFRNRMFNQRDEEVCSCLRMALLKTKA